SLESSLLLTRHLRRHNVKCREPHCFYLSMDAVDAGTPTQDDSGTEKSLFGAFHGLFEILILFLSRQLTKNLAENCKRVRSCLMRMLMRQNQFVSKFLC